MRVLCLVLIAGVVACNAAPGAANQEDGQVELFSGVTIQRYVDISCLIDINFNFLYDIES